jgi:hypothetical protein
VAVRTCFHPIVRTSGLKPVRPDGRQRHLQPPGVSKGAGIVVRFLRSLFPWYRAFDRRLLVAEVKLQFKFDLIALFDEI